MLIFALRYLLQVSLTAVLIVGIADAAPARADVDPAVLGKAQELMKVSGVQQSFEQVLPVLNRQLGKLIEQANPGKAATISEFMETKLTPRMLERSGELTELVAHVYARHFTLDELAQLIDFYNTPVGQKLVREQGQMMTESMQVGRRWGEVVGKEVLQELAPEFEQRGLEIPPI